MTRLEEYNELANQWKFVRDDDLARKDKSYTFAKMYELSSRIYDLVVDLRMEESGPLVRRYGMLLGQLRKECGLDG